MEESEEEESEEEDEGEGEDGDDDDSDDNDSEENDGRESVDVKVYIRPNSLSNEQVYPFLHEVQRYLYLPCALLSRTFADFVLQSMRTA